MSNIDYTRYPAKGMQTKDGKNGRESGRVAAALH